LMAKNRLPATRLAAEIHYRSKVKHAAYRPMFADPGHQR
jgi:hypothetical protein